MQKKILVFLLVLIATAHASWYTVYLSSQGIYTVSPGRDDPKGVAVADVEFTGNITGWNTLHVIVTGNYNDTVSMYAAGYIEGYLTQSLIWSSWAPFMYAQFNSSGFDIPQKVIAYYRENLAYVQTMIASHTDDPYWIHVGLVMQQLFGVTDGNNAAAPHGQELSLMQITLLNMDGDLDELVVALGLDTTNWMSLTAKEALRLRTRRDHCSALIKVTNDYTDLFAAHTTWEPFCYMLRVYKQYDFALHAEGTKSVSVSFSGYPGMLASVDDFYLTSQKLTVIETTNGNFNMSLYNAMTPKSLFSWLRTVVANRMAAGGEEWCDIFALENSGTYNNQWIIVDYKLFVPSQPLKSNLLWVLEQLPGYVEAEDVTDILSFGYWPSYNIPFFPDVYTLSGFGQMASKYGNEWTYSLCARAKIFRRDQTKVQNLTAMQTIMQYNNYQNDPFSQGDPTLQISARADLYPNPTPDDAFGGVDSKVVNYALMQQFSSSVVSGPSKDSQPPFSWSQFPHVPHDGQPDTFDFDWITMSFSE